MMNQKRILKGMIIFILLVFLLSTGLVSVMYFADKNSVGAGENLTGVNLSGDLITSGMNFTGINNTGNIK